MNHFLVTEQTILKSVRAGQQLKRPMIFSARAYSEENMLIDLSDHFHPTQHSAVLFEQGRDLSAKLSLPACVKGAKSVTILLPHHVWYIGNRFFEGLFGSCLDKLGKDEFLKIFKFESDSPPILKSIPLLVNEVWLRLHPPVDHAALYDVEP